MSTSLSHRRWTNSDKNEEDYLERILYCFVKHTNIKQGNHFRNWSQRRLYIFAALLRNKHHFLQPPEIEGMDFVAEFKRLYPEKCNGYAVTKQRAQKINTNIRDACPQQRQDPVEVRISSRGGFGLFATRTIHKHENITAYMGERIEYRQLYELQWDSTYVWTNRNHTINIDAIHPYRAGYGGYVNDALDPEEHIESTNNVNCTITATQGKKVWVRAIKEIEADEEILTAYGVDYWRWFLRCEALPQALYNKVVAAYYTELLNYPDSDIDTEL